MQAIEEVADLIDDGGSLSPSLRLTKYAKIGGDNEKKDAVDFVCSAKPLSFRPASIADSVPDAVSFKMKLMGRLIINQAGGVLENAGLCVHRHFGYPYIPGSALKGIARHAAWWEWSETESPETAKEIADIFGYPTGEPKLDDFLKSVGRGESSGKVSFLATTTADSKWGIVADILTSHHGCDTKNPTPLPFPTVEKGAVFIFTLLGKNYELREKATNWLKIALTEDGVGAKTAAGYGWFKEV
jgi:CRISPR-associated protein Cmr6